MNAVALDARVGPGVVMRKARMKQVEDDGGTGCSRAIEGNDEFGSRSVFPADVALVQDRRFSGVAGIGLIFFVFASNRMRNGWQHDVSLDQPTAAPAPLPPKVEPYRGSRRDATNKRGRSLHHNGLPTMPCAVAQGQRVGKLLDL
jgi:hypothetical protein